MYCEGIAWMCKMDSDEASDPNTKWYLYGASVAYQKIADRLDGILEDMEKVKVKE